MARRGLFFHLYYSHRFFFFFFRSLLLLSSGLQRSVLSSGELYSSFHSPFGLMLLSPFLFIPAPTNTKRLGAASHVTKPAEKKSQDPVKVTLDVSVLHQRLDLSSFFLPLYCSYFLHDRDEYTKCNDNSGCVTSPLSQIPTSANVGTGTEAAAADIAIRKQINEEHVRGAMRQRVPLRRLYYPNQVFISNDHRRIQYQWLPRRLLLVRHGESEANVNREVYSTTPDWKIPLTPLGREQAFDCGKRLRNIIKDEKLYIYYSPYARTRQTLDEIRRSFDESQIQGEREDERLREQEMGNYQPMADMDRTWASRNKFGRLYYRFPFGESGADVGDRVSGFFDSLLRERIGLTVPNMNERLMQGAREELGSLGLGRWSGEGDCLSMQPTGAHSGDAVASFTAPPPFPSSSFVSPMNGEAEVRPGAAGSSVSVEVRADASLPTSSAVPRNGPQRRDVPHHPSHHTARSLSHLGEASVRGVLPPNDHGASAGEDQNVLIVAHGLLIRLFIGRWFRVPMEVFDTMCNPPNCSIIVLERDDEIGRLVMTDISKGLFGSSPLLQMMKFDGQEDTHWYRQKFLGIVDPKKGAEEAVAEDDDENHYSKSAAHNRSVGAPGPRAHRTESSTAAAASVAYPARRPPPPLTAAAKTTSATQGTEKEREDAPEKS
jgi:broad specificity phosphatase PhoE